MNKVPYNFHYSPDYEQFRVFYEKFHYYFSPLCRVDTLGEIDRTDGLLKVRRISDSSFEIHFKSSIWERKISYVNFLPDRIEYYVKVRGRGQVGRVFFFTGIQDGKIWGSVPGFDSFTPGCPNFLGKQEFFVNEFFSIGQANDTTYWGHALSSGPFVFIFNRRDTGKKMWGGLVVPKGENCFDSFDFNYKSAEIAEAHDSIVNTQSFSIQYSGHQQVDGEWRTPTLVLGFSSGKLAALKNYCKLLETAGSIEPPRKRQIAWHRKPILCPWHEQCALGAQKELSASKSEGENPDFAGHECTQANHEKWLRILEKKKIPFGTLIIDAKWQKEHGRFREDTTKWPAMRKFIDDCHSKGIKVLLWLPSWVSREGVPDELCMKKSGLPVTVDPTHPEYRKIMEEGIEYMLGSKPYQLNADGFKVDGTTSIPAGDDVENHGRIYGTELQHLYCKILYEKALAVKPDALVSLFIANPYFRDVCDMVRLGDLYTVYGDPRETMRERLDIYQTAMKGKLVDTDGTMRFSVNENCIELLPEQPGFGIPCIYQVENLYQQRTFTKPQFRKLNDVDYRIIRKIFEQNR